MKAYEYYTTTVGDKGYVFFSDPSSSPYEKFYAHQFWQFSPLDGTWQKIADFPGMGRDRFTFVSDGSRYIYAGLGGITEKTQFGSDRIVIEGDIWQYDVQTDKWAFIGWTTEQGNPEIDHTSVIVNERILLFVRSSAIKAIELIPNKIKPY